MRRATLGSLSPSQLNNRSSTVRNGAAPRNGTGLSRKSGPQQQLPGGAATNAVKTGRPSLSRRSSSMCGKGTQTQTETRPIGDKAFQQECIATIVNYLTTKGYKHGVSPKILQTPSSKDVMNIIHFLFLRIDPNWEFKKLEEDVPLLFKRLGYPVPISRSSLYAAGSPVSWPSLLAALTWLTNLLVAMEPSEGGQNDSPFEDKRNNHFTEYVNSSYHHFLRGEDDACDALDAAYVKKVMEENDKCVTELEDLQAEANKLQEQLRELKSEPSRLTALRAKHADYKDDIVKFNMVISNFSSHKEAMEKKRDEKRQELAAKKDEAVNIVRENEELRDIVASQQINAADVEKMLKEKEILEVNLQSVSCRKQELEKTAWDNEINSSKTLRDLETAMSQFNDSRERLGMSSQFDLKLRPRENTPADIIGGTVKTVIKPALMEIIAESRKVLAEQINPETLRLQEQLFRREIVARERQSQISNAVALNKKLEAQCRARELTLDVTAIRTERQELEERMVEEELSLKNEEADTEYELQEMEAQFEATVKMCNEEIERERKAGTEILDVILSTKEETRATLQRAEEVAAKSIEAFQNLVSSSQV